MFFFSVFSLSTAIPSPQMFEEGNGYFVYFNLPFGIALPDGLTCS